MARTVVVTGGTRGIGLAIAHAFADQGDCVFAGARRAGDAGDLGAVRVVEMDVRVAADHARLVDAAVRHTGTLDVFVNGAGLSGWRALPEVDAPFWDLLIDTNLKGTFLGCQAAARALGRGGSIINVSSLAGKRGSARNAVYCASKFGVNGLTQALARELGARGIRVNAVCPVYVETPGLLDALQGGDAPPAGQPLEAYLADFARTQSALGRLPTAAEVGATCVFLASPAAAAITGQCLNVDCGVLPQ
jgi:NAD(P)-dependent dehydrogenase (short-subunit alcohol dehydrogenase family)